MNISYILLEDYHHLPLPQDGWVDDYLRSHGVLTFDDCGKGDKQMIQTKSELTKCTLFRTADKMDNKCRYKVLMKLIVIYIYMWCWAVNGVKARERRKIFIAVNTHTYRGTNLTKYTLWNNRSD